MDDNKEQYFKYLEELRKSGVTNMFGAVPYLVNEFDLSWDEAKEILKEWMNSYSELAAKYKWREGETPDTNSETIFDESIPQEVRTRINKLIDLSDELKELKPKMKHIWYIEDCPFVVQLDNDSVKFFDSPDDEDVFVYDDLYDWCIEKDVPYEEVSEKIFKVTGLDKPKEVNLESGDEMSYVHTDRDIEPKDEGYFKEDNKEFKPGEEVNVRDDWGESIPATIVRKVPQDELDKLAYSLNPQAPGGYYEIEYNSLGRVQKSIEWVRRLSHKNTNEDYDEYNEVDPDDIYQGDLVDFGVYGKLYVCNPEYSEKYFWVTDDKSDRCNTQASGWSIRKTYAEKIIERCDDETEDESLNKDNEDAGGYENIRATLLKKYPNAKDKLTDEIITKAINFVSNIGKQDSNFDKFIAKEKYVIQLLSDWLEDEESNESLKLKEGRISGREKYTTEELTLLESKLFQLLKDNQVYPEDGTFRNSSNPLGDLELFLIIDGDWKHDHLFVQSLVEKFCKENKLSIVKHEEETLNDTGSDDYKAVHTWQLLDNTNGDMDKVIDGFKHIFASKQEGLKEQKIDDGGWVNDLAVKDKWTCVYTDGSVRELPFPTKTDYEVKTFDTQEEAEKFAKDTIKDTSDVYGYNCVYIFDPECEEVTYYNKEEFKDSKESYNTEDRIKELRAIKAQRPLTDEEEEELAYCENEVSSREAERKYLNGKSNESLNEAKTAGDKLLAKIKSNIEEDPNWYEDQSIEDIAYNTWIDSDIEIPNDYLDDPDKATDEEVDDYFYSVIYNKEFKDKLNKLFNKNESLNEAILTLDKAVKDSIYSLYSKGYKNITPEQVAEDIAYHYEGYEDWIDEIEAPETTEKYKNILANIMTYFNKYYNEYYGESLKDDKKRLKYLYNKEQCCSLDKAERFELQNLIQKYGKPTKEESLNEAKPEGDKIFTYNKALAIAKKNSKPVIYGYTHKSLGAKFFEVEPIICDNIRNCEKEFRNRYKNCGTVYVAYPDNDFVEY